MSRILLYLPSPSSRQRRHYPASDQTNEYTFVSDNQDGVNLFDAYHSRAKNLEGENDGMFVNYGTKVTYIMKFREKKHSKQKYAKNSKGTVTRKKAIQQVAQVALDALRDEYGRDIPVEDLKPWYLMKLERTGKSSFRCILAYDKVCGRPSPSDAIPPAVTAPTSARAEVLEAPSPATQVLSYADPSHMASASPAIIPLPHYAFDSTGPDQAFWEGLSDYINTTELGGVQPSNAPVSASHDAANAYQVSHQVDDHIAQWLAGGSAFPAAHAI